MSGFSYRMIAWARETKRIGGRSWDRTPAWDALNEGEQETVRGSRRYHRGRDRLGRLDEQGDASALVDAVLAKHPEETEPGEDALVVRTAGECVFWVANGRGWLLEQGRWLPLDVAPGLAGKLLTSSEVAELVAVAGRPT